MSNTAANLGVRTLRGDFERALVSDVLRALQVAGIDELSAGDLLALVAVEDLPRIGAESERMTCA